MSKYSGSIESARRRAMHMAMREHASLGSVLTKRIDIFGILKQQQHPYVMFQPLNPLYGAYVGAEGANGILINANHPPNLQRFTAAHEYGHFIMEHGPSTDKEEQILSSQRNNTWQEVEAQTFAAHFLMPLQLINTCLHRLGLPFRPKELIPGDAYALYHLSLELGVSYTAVINHLVSLGKLNLQVATKLKATTPKVLKEAIGGGVGPQNSWADVWTFNTRDAGREISLYVDDELHINLPESATGNDEWKQVSLNITDPVILISSNGAFAQPVGQYVGKELEYSRHFLFRAHAPGYVSLRLEKQGSPYGIFELHITVLPRYVQGLLH